MANALEVVFSLALAVGSLLATGDELVDALLGAPGTLGPWELILAIAVAVAVTSRLQAKSSPRAGLQERLAARVAAVDRLGDDHHLLPRRRDPRRSEVRDDVVGVAPPPAGS